MQCIRHNIYRKVSQRSRLIIESQEKVARKQKWQTIPEIRIGQYSPGLPKPFPLPTFSSLLTQCYAITRVQGIMSNSHSHNVGCAESDVHQEHCHRVGQYGPPTRKTRKIAVFILEINWWINAYPWTVCLSHSMTYTAIVRSRKRELITSKTPYASPFIVKNGMLEFAEQWSTQLYLPPSLWCSWKFQKKS